MKRRAFSLALVGVAVTIIAVAAGIGASVYYLGTGVSAGQTTTCMSTTPASSCMSSTTMMTNSMISTTSSTGMMSSAMMTSSVSSSAMMSSSMMTSSQSSSGQGAQLQITLGPVSHSLSGYSVAATCGSGMPAQGAVYLEVTNTGTAPTAITNVSFNYVDMVTESGAPTGACTIAAGATAYITVTGVGMDMASAGELFSVSITGTNGGFAYANGAFS